MGIENVECRSSEFWSCGQVGYVENKSTVLGKVETTCGTYGTNEVAINREDCRGGDSTARRQRKDNSIDGKVIDQLASKIESEISYHESQVDDLKSRLKELRDLSGDLNKTDNSD